MQFGVLSTCVWAVLLYEWASDRLDPSSPELRRPLCRFKSCPSEPANSSCSIFIKPLSLKEPYPEHGKSHSSRSHSPALSILTFILLLPALLCLSPPLFTSPSICPSSSTPSFQPLPLFLSLALKFSYIHSDTHSFSLSHTHIYINTHTPYTCSCTHSQFIRARHTCAGCWGGRAVPEGLFAASLSLRVLCYHLGKKRVSVVFSFLFLSFLEC